MSTADRPDREPDEVGHDEQEAEQDEQPVPLQVVVGQRHPHRVLGHRLERDCARIARGEPVREQEEVAIDLGRVAEAVDLRVAQSLGSTRLRERREPRKESDRHSEAEVERGRCLSVAASSRVAAPEAAGQRGGQDEGR